MNDTELLKLAAKATVYKGHYYAFEMSGESGIVDGEDCDSGFWNPLVNDADTFRLENALIFDVRHTPVAVLVGLSTDQYKWHHELLADHNNDRNKARRYASTRLAAEIGRAME